MADESNNKNEPVEVPALIELDFGPAVGVRRFFSADELADFANRLATTFDWIAKPKHADGTARHIRGMVWGAIEPIKTQADALRKAMDEGRSDSVPGLKSGLTDAVRQFAERKLLGPDDPRSQWLQKLAAENQRQAIFVLGHMTGHLSSITTSEEVAAVVNSVAFDLGMRDAIPGASATFTEVLRTWALRHSELSEQLASARALLEDIRSERAEDSRSQTNAFGQAQGKRAEDFTALLEKNTAELDGFKKAYNEDLATRSAVKYWGEKAWIHRGLALATGLIGAVGGILYFGIAVPSSFSNLVKHFEVGADQQEWRAGILVGLILLGIWLGRIAVRLFLSQIHLAADASHRRVALLSYIALLKNETNAVTAEDRSLVLGTVFRPISDGLIRDDAMPPSPWELLTRTPKT